MREEALSSCSPGRAALRLVVTAAVFAVVVYAVSSPPAWFVWPALWLLAVGAILSCGAMVHEAAHRHLFKGKWPNHTVGIVCSAALGAPFVAYRDTHLEHHRFTHQPGDTDPLDVLQKPYEFVLGLPVYGFVYIYNLYAIALATLFGRGPSYRRGDSRARRGRCSHRLPCSPPWRGPWWASDGGPPSSGWSSPGSSG
ncbi:MAG: fatty acid desaturase [Microthrixaceae bacterium]